jgi:CheY-like chemotaxis protein
MAMATTNEKKNSVLVVDDDPTLCESLVGVLQVTGHESRCAHDGFSGLLEIRGQFPDVILSDLNMPGMSGFEFLSVVRRKFPQIRVIAMSGAYAGRDVPPGIAADAFYAKGSGVKNLLELVDEKATPRIYSLDSCTPEAPAWLPSAVSDPSGDVYVLLCCPECLRCSKQLVPDPGAMPLGTQCASCGTAFHYALVQPEPSAAIQMQIQQAGRTAAGEPARLSARAIF